MTEILYPTKAAKNTSYSRNVAGVRVDRGKGRGAGREATTLPQARADGVWALLWKGTRGSTWTERDLQLASAGLAKGVTQGKGGRRTQASAQCWFLVYRYFDPNFFQQK